MAEAAKLRRSKRCRSTTGCFSVSSHTISRERQMTAVAARITIVLEWNQSSSPPLSSMICNDPTPIARSARPIASMGSFTILLSRSFMRSQITYMQMMPMGTLM